MVSIRRPLDLLTYASCVLGVAPLFPFLEPPAQVAAPLALVLGVICDRRRRYLFGRHFATLVSSLLFGYYLLRIDRTALVEPVANVLVLLLAIRLVTPKGGRNYLQIFLLALFALAGSSLLSLSLFFLPDLVLLVLCITVGLVLLCFFSSDAELALPRRAMRSVVGTALLLPGGSLLLMLVFFVILPRTEQPLWNFLNPGAAATSGFAQSVRPGAFASNAAVPDLVFRAQTEQLPAQDLYWRGTVLNTPQGESWVREKPPAGADERLQGGRRVAQTIYLEPRNDHFLFALEAPGPFANIRSVSSVDGVTRTPGRPGQSARRVSYQVVSRVGATRTPAAPLQRAFYLRLPDRVSPRLRATADALTTRAPDAAARVAATEDFFRRQQLSYATTDLPGPAAPIEEFLFTKKRGYCEFFASSFALLLRLEGVPARLVGGYHGGTWNAFGGYYAVTENLAHVWVEALVDGRWQRLDPSTLAVNAASELSAAQSQTTHWGRSLVDAAEYYWTRTVITYDLGRQLDLLRGGGRSLRRLRPAAPSARQLLLTGGLLLAAGAVIWLLRRRRFSPEQRLVREFLALAARRLGEDEIGPAAGLDHLARRLGDPLSREFAAIAGAALYRDRSLTRQEQLRLQKLLGELRRRDA